MPQNLAYTALLLGVLVFVHEFGHFIVAKACGVKVLKFSIGFGPRLIGFTRGETEYRISLLPLGGYVRMAGELPTEELEPEEAKRGFLAQPPWKRGLIVAAGPFFNLVFPVLVYFFVFVGTHEALAPQVGSVDAGTPAAQVLEPGDKILAVDGERVRTFEEMRKKVQPRFDHEIHLTIERQGDQKVVPVTPLRATDTNPIESVPRGFIGISAQEKPAVLGVPVGSPAEAAGFHTFDRIISVNSRPVKTEVDLDRALNKAGEALEVGVERAKGSADTHPEHLTLKTQKHPGSGYMALGGEGVDAYVYEVTPGSPASAVGIAVGDRLVSFNGKPLASFRILELALGDFRQKPFQLGWSHAGGPTQTAQLRLVKKDVKDELGAVTEQYELGVLPRSPKEGEVPDFSRVRVYHSPTEALAESLRIVPEIIGKTALVIGMLFTGQVPFKTVGGPIMLYQLASKSAEAGMEQFLNLMAVISINLGMMNLLPIPVLDGFQLLASVWEGVRRRPIPTRAREIANAVGLAMLLILMILVFKNDLTR
jgi:regulator of sigma E protease